MNNGTNEIDCGESLEIPTTDYSGETSPCKARHVTLQEVVDYCARGMRAQEQDGGLLSPDKYFSLEDVKKYCEGLQNQIKW